MRATFVMADDPLEAHAHAISAQRRYTASWRSVPLRDSYSLNRRTYEIDLRSSALCTDGCQPCESGGEQGEDQRHNRVLMEQRDG